ncbi:Golgi transport complex subunit [Martiniozyma asiatica (nom. inval.)]|nr:Golgi transport complex subunit [Martiniozyma asiatica]
MDFIYETDTLSNEKGYKGSSSYNISNFQAFQSLSKQDLSMKLGSLNLLSLSKKNNDKGESDNCKFSKKKADEHARQTVEYIESLGLSNSNQGSTQDSDLMYKLTNMLEGSTAYDAIIKPSLDIIENKIKTELQSINKNNNESKAKRKFLQNVTSAGPLGSMSRGFFLGLLEEETITEQSISLKKFHKVIDNVRDIKEDIENVALKANNAQNVIQTTIENSKPIKREIDNLINEKKEIDSKKEFLIAFKNDFTLNEFESHILQYGDLSDAIAAHDFFKAVEKVKNIQNNCDLLLGQENITLGTKIMRQTNEILESVNSRVLRYIQKNIEIIYSGRSSIISNNSNAHVFQIALIYIWNNDKSGFDSVVSNLVETRSKIVLSDFMMQLQEYTDEIVKDSSQSDFDRKSGRLFLSSYDTTRFISDTLAYIHSVLVNEMEGARSLLTFEFSKEVTIPTSELENAVCRIVQSIVSCMCRPLKNSIDNILRQETKLRVLVTVSGLIDLYKSMYEKLLGDGTLILPTDIPDEIIDGTIVVPKKNDYLIATLNQLENGIQDRAFSVVNLKLKKIHADAKEEDIDEKSNDSILPDWIVDWFGWIDDIFQEKDTSGRSHILGFNDNQWLDFLKLLVTKPLDIVYELVKNHKKNIDSVIWEINCIDYMIGRLSVIPEFTNKSKELDEILKVKVTNLQKREFDALLENSGLFDIYNLINMIFKLDEEFFDVIYYQPITENKLFNKDTFVQANTKLESFLSNYIDENKLTKLMSPKIYQEIFDGSSVKFVKFYGKLLAITSEYLTDKSGEAFSIFKWDEQSIATLLGIEEYYVVNT